MSLLASQLDGSAAVPRRNGELVFEEPWQSRAFGMAVALAEAGVFEWDEFRGRLIAAIAAEDRPYYDSWLEALERLLLEKRLVEDAELHARMERLAHEDDHAH